MIVQIMAKRYVCQAWKGVGRMPKGHRAEEGRGERRNVSGELQASDEPDESEWGNPRTVRAGVSGVECIDDRRGTGGTETSQYLEEKTSSEIPVVVASEPGRAQTAG